MQVPIRSSLNCEREVWATRMGGGGGQNLGSAQRKAGQGSEASSGGALAGGVSRYEEGLRNASWGSNFAGNTTGGLTCRSNQSPRPSP
jgi:hypothetical protein